jgi:hypothetical protein
MFSKKRRIEPAVRRALDNIGEDVVRAKLSWIMNVTSLRSAATASHHEGGEQLGDNLTAPLWVIQQWLAEKDVRRQRWVKAAAILAGLAVVVPLFTWYFPISDSRPELATTVGSIDVHAHPKVAGLQWHNFGKEPARGGIVTLFIFENGKGQTELGTDKIIGAGTNVMPDYNGDARVELLDTKQLGDELLACVTYLGDDDGKYEQAFVYHNGGQDPRQQNAIKLLEVARPRYHAVCP